MAAAFNQPLKVMLLGGPRHDSCVTVDIDALKRNGWRLYLPQSEEVVTFCRVDVIIKAPLLAMYEARKCCEELFFAGFSDE
jgi:hypothetical protein